MIKPRCPVCQRYFLGPACPCGSGPRPRKLACACGREAVEVWVDELGEWPLCAACLAQLQADQEDLSEIQRSLAETAPQAQPDSGSNHPTAPDEVETAFSGPSMSLDEVRLLLSQGEFEVAGLAHLTNLQIADRLGISVGSVKSRLYSLRHKLGLRTRNDLIRLFSALGESPPPDRQPPPLTFSLTIKGPIDRLHEIISRLVRGR
jgi:DNA-binding CsgD family transcriptional regulator